MDVKTTVIGDEIEQKEIEAYVDYVKKNNPNNEIEWINIELDGNHANLSYKLNPVPFERIRRITGYLVGTVDRFNNAKRAEEHDRVKHM